MSDRKQPMTVQPRQKTAADPWRASWWDLLRARLFGRRFADPDGFTVYLWRGRFFVVACPKRAAKLRTPTEANQ